MENIVEGKKNLSFIWAYVKRGWQARNTKKTDLYKMKK